MAYQRYNLETNGIICYRSNFNKYNNCLHIFYIIDINCILSKSNFTSFTKLVLLHKRTEASPVRRKSDS